MKIRALIVDDEPLARQRLRLLGKDDPDLEWTGECGNGAEALAAVEKDKPDLVFLDVRMPGLDGFEVLEKIPASNIPLVIFTTAYDEHALRAFEAHALDYLLKPIRPERFQAAVARARDLLACRQAGQAARGLLDLLAERQGAPPASRFLSRLTVRTGEKVAVVPVQEIDSIESAGNYVAIHIGKDNHILRETLSALEGQLDPSRFLRISRSAIVNLDRIKELQPAYKGEHVVVLHNGRRLAMTRGLREVEQALRFG